jgi:hypothetical protein
MSVYAPVSFLLTRSQLAQFRKEAEDETREAGLQVQLLKQTYDDLLVFYAADKVQRERERGECMS